MAASPCSPLQNLRSIHIQIIQVEHCHCHRVTSVSEESNWASRSSPLVINGPSPPTQVHLRSEDIRGSHRGLIEKEESASSFLTWCRPWLWLRLVVLWSGWLSDGRWRLQVELLVSITWWSGLEVGELNGVDGIALLLRFKEWIAKFSIAYSFSVWMVVCGGELGGIFSVLEGWEVPGLGKCCWLASEAWFGGDGSWFPWLGECVFGCLWWWWCKLPNLIYVVQYLLLL